ncbi:MAG: adenosylcobinamide amidohydrolase [Peptococcaceae bacterium]|nr:adenosylcobinamide amidohydrolase [Peptococcaceae bacterium]
MLEELPVYFHKQVAIQGIGLFVCGRSTFIAASASPLKTIGSTVLGGDLRQARYIINQSVDKDYHGSDPEEDLRRVALRLRLGYDVLGMMTAVCIKQTVLNQERHKNLVVAALCTAGLGNPGAAGLPAGDAPDRHRPGTINIILLIDGNLTDAAMVNAVMTATEAKTRALFKAGIRLPGGEPVTGTTSDAIVVACTGRGDSLRYAGTATDLGYMIGKTVYGAVLQGIEKYLRWRGNDDEGE